MENLILIMIFVIAVNYCLLILYFTLGIKRLRKNSQADSTVKYQQSNAVPVRDKDNFLQKKVSVIIAARNEEGNIAGCLNSIVLQDYPKELFEVIVVNDQSEDKTGEIINHFISSDTINLKQLVTTGDGGKKAALGMALEKSTGTIILVTDADCQPSAGWIKSMVSCFHTTNALMVAGPVVLKDKGSIFSKFQVTEFNSLIASTAGSIGKHKPIMCNGANLGFVKEVITATDAFKKDYSSGDDVFLMLSIKKRFGADRIKFLNDPAGIVYTQPLEKTGDFINQRIRWTSKSGGYKDAFLIYSAISVLSLNLVIFILSISWMLQAKLYYPFSSSEINLLPYLTGIAFILKCLTDYILLHTYSKMLRIRNQTLLLLILFEPLVIVYTSLIGIIGNIMPFKWKGREHKI